MMVKQDYQFLQNTTWIRFKRYSGRIPTMFIKKTFTGACLFLLGMVILPWNDIHLLGKPSLIKDDALQPVSEDTMTKRIANETILSQNIHKVQEKICQPMTLINDSRYPLTALASFPGSGNTWLRHLIHQATGTSEQHACMVINSCSTESSSSRS